MEDLVGNEEVHGRFKSIDVYYDDPHGALVIGSGEFTNLGLIYGVLRADRVTYLSGDVDNDI